MPVSATPRYKALRRLGSGGMAAVYLARDERLGREVAIKRLHADSPEEVGRRFQREAKVGASLNHPNLVAVYDTVTDDEGVLIVMEYVDGHTLRDELERGPLEPAHALEILAGVAAGLDHAHASGVVHRDVKPANVLIAKRNGMVKLADLGIAMAAQGTRITNTGSVLGTAAYMAPERLDGKPGGPPADVYALAALAFEALSGRKAFTGASPMEIATRVATLPAPDLRDVQPGAPGEAAEVLRRGLAKDPADRPATAGQFVRELTAAYAAAATAGRPPTAPTRPVVTHTRTAARRPRRLLAVAALAAVGALAIAIALASSAGGGKTHKVAARSTTRHHARTAQHRTHAPRHLPPAVPATPPGTAATPTAAVSTFYARAASHDYQGAWALGTDRLHAQLGGLAAFSAQQSHLRSISFPRLQTTSQSGSTAVVSFDSMPVLDTGPAHCTGQAALVRGGSGWLLDQLSNVQCGPQGGGPAPAPPNKPAKPGKPPKSHGPKGAGPPGHGKGQGGQGGD